MRMNLVYNARMENLSSVIPFDVMSLFLNGAHINMQEMSFLKDIVIDSEAHFLVLIVQSSSIFSEIFGYTACRQLLQMLISIIFFHVSEYILALVIHGKSNVSLKSLLISKHYLLAMICSLIEYLIEIYFFPGLKEYWWISNLGLALVVLGEIIRKLAIVTAGRAFTHLIKVYHEEDHQLVTDGIYRFVRHPGYCGFFIWSVGTQIMLCNPISTVGFAVVVWKFFSSRIPYEEFFLKQFFGSDYEDYMRKVPSGIPLVK
ncbi:protein-S-isoprenylcysteine O-methyltransferase A-like isoform X1 [Lycium ferocissimum]|uniref:protein-S-isoprenylcysteine O-methyltransferase A-like isoform X1 n=2 Tax=Lycium ferocissimum TaxID=112874 RepID=UPI002815B093|nr:protein-S-isoprenylcysteine O-methyltransferase A-like isoform X1 [Lycium ferocissimum]